MVSVQRMRMLLPNTHVDLDAELVGAIRQLPHQLILAHAVKAGIFMLDYALPEPSLSQRGAFRAGRHRFSCRSRMPFAFLHCSGQCAVRFRPGSFHLCSERCAKTLLERPEQGSTHCPIVIRRDTVTPVPLAELAYSWQNGIELMKIVDGLR